MCLLEAGDGFQEASQGPWTQVCTGRPCPRRNPARRLEKSKREKEACGEIGTEHPCYLGSQGTFYVGCLKGVGRFHAIASDSVIALGLRASKSCTQLSCLHLTEGAKVLRHPLETQSIRIPVWDSNMTYGEFRSRWWDAEMK